MAKKIVRFGKEINTPKTLAIYNEQKTYYDEVKQLEKQKDECFKIYWGMEGKYSIGTASDHYAGQGCRGYEYKYSSQEIKAQEIAERNAYYAEYISPLCQRINELNQKAWALEEVLCVALWGFGQEHYRIKRNLENAEKELAEQIAYVEELRKELKKLEKGD